jgi:hypothetical protein
MVIIDHFLMRSTNPSGTESRFKKNGFKVTAHPGYGGAGRGYPARVRQIASMAPMALRRAVLIAEQMPA